MRRRPRSLGCYLLALAPVATQSAVWEREIAVEKTGFSLAAFPLDSQVTASARLDLSDLRVFDPAGHSLGQEIRPVYNTQRFCEEQALPMERIQARATGDQGFEAVFAHLDSPAIPSKAMVHIAGEDFEINVSLWTAEIPASIQKPAQIKVAELKWNPRIRAEPLYDYSRMLSLRKDWVEWGTEAEKEKEKDRLVKIQVGGLSQSQRSALATLSGRIGQPTQETFQIATHLMRVESITFSGMVCRDAAFAQVQDTADLAWSPGPTPLPETNAKRSWYRFHPGGLPLRSLIFQVAPGNFMRSIRITGWPDSVRRGTGDSSRPWTWPVLAEGQLRRMDWGESRDSLLSLAIAPTERMRELAIGIQDRDDPPLILTQVRGIWGRQQVFFPLTQPGRYRLQFGMHGIPPYESEFSEMFQRISAPTYLPATLGTPRLLDSVEMAPQKPWISGATLLSLGLGIGILTLTALLWGVAKKAKGV